VLQVLRDDNLQLQLLRYFRRVNHWIGIAQQVTLLLPWMSVLKLCTFHHGDRVGSTSLQFRHEACEHQRQHHHEQQLSVRALSVCLSVSMADANCRPLLARREMQKRGHW